MVAWGCILVRRNDLKPLPLRPISAALLCYALINALGPPLVATSAALCLLGCALYRSLTDRWPPLSVIGLILLLMPIIPSLQFYLGYPARWLSTLLSLPLLHLSGYSVEQVGTSIVWAGQRLAFDAPCSGIKMLWGLSVLGCGLGLLHQWNNRTLLRWFFWTLLLIVPANALRGASLFMLEQVKTYQALSTGKELFLHQGIGAACFVLCGALLLWLMKPAYE